MYIIIEKGSSSNLVQYFHYNNNSLSKHGFKGNQTSFYQWFNLQFPDYQSKRKLLDKTSKTASTDYEIVRLNTLLPNKLAIYLFYPKWGVSATTGECSNAHLLAEEIISSSTLLKDIREVYTSFRAIINGEDKTKLKPWLEKYKTTTIRRIRSLVNGIKRDLEAVENAIKYKWSNGLVEGHVNRLKNKKREMYGRAEFDLLKRKVILSCSG